MYIDLAGFVTRLTENISYKSRHLPIPQKDYDFLLENLADEDYSFLEVRDGKAIEYIKVMNVCDKIVLERGAEQTRTTAFRCGTGVSFRLTMQGVKDTVCQMENCDDV